jgi:phospholipase C
MDSAIENLAKVDHIVVLMLENRSFDHMLGYLSLPGENGGGRTDVDGLSGPDVNFNEYGDPPGKRYPIAPFDNSVSLTKEQDPCHSGACVAEQTEDDMGGFVRNYMTTRPPGSTVPRPEDPMRYQTPSDVPVFDFLAGNFAICDRWFCSVPGSTWPNRIASLAGEARETDNKAIPLYERTSFVRSLPEHVTWRWYSSDPGSLRLVDRDYLVGWEGNFAQVERPSALQPRTLYGDIASGDLPQLSWIDPNFVDLGGLTGADDDHPPTDPMAAQSFVLKIYNALRAKRSLWRKTMFVIVYDEHGGFYDHRSPADPGLPREFTERAEFGVFGPRVPAIVVSPFVVPGKAYGSAQDNDSNFLFDHTSLIKTILLRFAGGDFSQMPTRVASAAHLGHLLTEPQPHDPPAPPQSAIDEVTGWWAKQIGLRLENPQATVAAMLELEDDEGRGLEGAGQWFWRLADWLVDHLPFLHPRQGGAKRSISVPQDANELELGIAKAAQRIRGQGLPPGQP